MKNYIFPKQDIIASRELVISGKRFNGCNLKKVLIRTIRYDENGAIVLDYMGNEENWQVQRYSSDGVPVGCRYFGGEEIKAKRYFNNNNF